MMMIRTRTLAPTQRTKMNKYEYLEDDYEGLPGRTKILKKPSKFQREGSLTDYLRMRTAEKNSVYNRKEKYA